MIHGDRDTIVPIDLGRRLFETALETKAWHEIKGADHNDTCLVGGEDYFRKIRETIEGWIVK